MRATSFEGDDVLLGYDGLDGTRRGTRLRFSPSPEQLTENSARYRVELQPQQELVVEIAIACEESDEVERRPDPSTGPQATSESLARLKGRGAELQTTNEQFNDWLGRSDTDLAMMTTHTPHGDYPYAGVPWFSAIFGRDGIITALECLWVKPEMASGVLRVLAATQASSVVPKQDAEPGKIVHEMRNGEMARLGEVPFGRYYGSADATPLFVMLAAAYYRRTADLALVRHIWPNIQRALEWMTTYGDRDHDGFLEYERQVASGLGNQGWKDSYDSIFHADGSLAEGPIALAEIQGYAYAARRGAAILARALGDGAQADQLEHDAETLRKHFEDAFWLEELGTYAEALDGNKRPCRIRTSNPGHCLYTGIVESQSSGARRPRTALRGGVLGVGRAHARRRRAALQPDVVPRRVGVAARQRDHRRRHGPLRHDRCRAAHPRGDVCGQPVHRSAAAAGAVLRLSAARRGGPDGLSGRLLAAGLGVRIGLFAAAGVPGRRHRRARGRGALQPGQAARLRRGAVDQRPARRRRVARSRRGATDR